METRRPVLVFVVGPGAVGKMTVGTELATRTGLKLFHNHQTIDLLLHYFPFGSPPFGRLLGEFRRRIFEEVAASELPGLIFTYVWAFDQSADHAEVELYASIFRSRGGSVFQRRQTRSWPRTQASLNVPWRGKRVFVLRMRGKRKMVPKEGSTPMTFARVSIEDIPVMCVSERGAPPVAGPRAFARLESALASMRGRKFYGVFDPRTGEYRACVTLQEGDDPEGAGCSRGSIPGGTYLRARLRGEADDTTPRISETFAAMAAAATPDPSRRGVEFYRQRDEVDLLFPVR